MTSHLIIDSIATGYTLYNLNQHRFHGTLTTVHESVFFFFFFFFLIFKPLFAVVSSLPGQRFPHTSAKFDNTSGGSLYYSPFWNASVGLARRGLLVTRRNIPIIFFLSINK